MWTCRNILIILTVLISLALIDGMPARRGGGGGGGGNGGSGARCKYRKGQWGECNATTLKKLRTDTLTTDASGSTCNATRIFEKPCRRKTCEYGEWTEYGACENNKQTKTRPILTGDETTCGKKAKKTKTCRTGGGGGGGGGRGGQGQQGQGGRGRGGQGGGGRGRNGNGNGGAAAGAVEGGAARS